jgi:hypothetical protein
MVVWREWWHVAMPWVKYILDQSDRSSNQNSEKWGDAHVVAQKGWV